MTTASRTRGPQLWSETQPVRYVESGRQAAWVDVPDIPELYEPVPFVGGPADGREMAVRGRMVRVPAQPPLSLLWAGDEHEPVPVEIVDYVLDVEITVRWVFRPEKRP